MLLTVVLVAVVVVFGTGTFTWNPSKAIVRNHPLGLSSTSTPAILAETTPGRLSAQANSPAPPRSSPGTTAAAPSPIAMSLTTKQRAVAAVVGGFVADAASMGLHWIYDMDKLASLLGAAPQPEFYQPPSCPFYQYESGVFSPYGDEVLPLLRDVAAWGKFDAPGFATASYEFAKAYKGRLNGVFREMVKKGDAGETYPNLASESKDLHGGIKTPVLVARYLGDVPQLVAKTKEATRVHQIGQEAEDAAVTFALLLHDVVQGTAVPEAIAKLTTAEHVGTATRAEIQEVLDAVRDKTFPNAAAAVDKWGKSCGLPGVLKGALFVLLTTDNYVDAVRANMVTGGDNCSRSIVVGAITAAASSAGTGAIPEDWKAKTTHFDEIQRLAAKLVE